MSPSSRSPGSRLLTEYSAAVTAARISAEVLFDLMTAVCYIFLTAISVLMPGYAAIPWSMTVLAVFYTRHISKEALLRRRQAFPINGFNIPLFTFTLVAGISAIQIPILMDVDIRLRGTDRLAEYEIPVLDSPLGLGGMILPFVVAAPVIEEWTFRGWIQPALRRYMGPSVAVVVTSFLFACFHPHSHLLAIFVAGVMFGSAAQLTGSILPSIYLHGLWNASAFLGGVAAPQFFPGSDGTPSQALADLPTPLILALSLLLLGLIGLRYTAETCGD